ERDLGRDRAGDYRLTVRVPVPNEEQDRLSGRVWDLAVRISGAVANPHVTTIGPRVHRSDRPWLRERVNRVSRRIQRDLVAMGVPVPHALDLHEGRVRELGRTCGECIEPRLPGRRREREARHDLAILAGRRDVRGDQRVLSIVVDPEVRLRLLERHRLLDRLIRRDAYGLHASTFPFFAFGFASPFAASRTRMPACSATSAQRGGTSAGPGPNARTVWP